MNTAAILLTTSLTLLIAMLLLRPFFARKVPVRSARRKRPDPKPGYSLAYRISESVHNAGTKQQRPAPVRATAMSRKIPPMPHYGHQKNSEAYSNR